MKPFHHRFRVPFHELDPGGVLFFAHLLVHAHQSYEEMMREIGEGLGELLAGGRHALPIVHTTADYFHPLKLDDAVEVQLEVTDIGTTSFELEYRFLRDGLECASATTRHVLLGLEDGRPTPLPAGLVAALARYRREAG